MKAEARKFRPHRADARASHSLRRSLLLALSLAAIAVFAVCAAEASNTTAVWSLPAAIFWTVLLGLSAQTTLPLPSLRRQVGLDAFFEFNLLLLYGATPACCFVLLGRGGALTLERMRRANGAAAARGTGRFGPGPRLQRKLYEVLGSLLALGAAGLVLERFSIGPATLRFESIGLGGACAAGTYLAIRLLMASVLEGRRATVSPRAGSRTVALHAAWEAFLLLYAFLLVSLHARIGLPAFLACLPPLAFLSYGQRLWLQARRGHVEAVRALTAAIDAADPMTRGLSERISKMSIQVARRLGLDPEEILELEYAGLLHEVGRTAIQRDVRFKPGGLSREEKAELRMHPSLGGEVVQRFGFFPGAPGIVHAHHEQPDGQGYPRGLRGEDIPMGSRILMAVAAFDAMTSDRPYRRGLPPKTAFDELLSLAGQQFFPDIVEALIDLYASGELFASFETDLLESFARGEGSSRALEEHLVRRGHRLPRPVASQTEARPEDDGVPILDLPMAADDSGTATPKSAQERTHVVHEQFDLGCGSGLVLHVGAITDVGCVRQNNEDAFGLFRELPHRGNGDSGRTDAGCLVVVADGMGGAAGGEVASNLAVDMVRDSYFGNDVRASCRDSLHEALRLANELIHWRAAAESELQGMGTTCTAAALVGSELHVAHVGDSRAYLVRAGSVESLTRDHTLAAELKAATGQEGPPGAHSVLTRCLGSRTDVEVELSRAVQVQSGDVLVLCSDGLWNQVAPQEIRELVLAQSPDQACAQLVERARQRGGPDNITVVVARVDAA